MSFDRFATAMIAAGAGLGLAFTSMVPTSAHAPERTLPQVDASAYPEITAVTYESYPVATVPLFHRAPLKLASWEKPWLEPPAGDYAEPLPKFEQYDGSAPSIDPQIAEDRADEPDDTPAFDDQVDEPVELSLSDHP